MRCEFSSLLCPFDWNWSYLRFLGIIWRTCGRKCRLGSGSMFPTLCESCPFLLLFQNTHDHHMKFRCINNITNNLDDTWWNTANKNGRYPPGISHRTYASHICDSWQTFYTMPSVKVRLKKIHVVMWGKLDSGRPVQLNRLCYYTSHALPWQVGNGVKVRRDYIWFILTVINGERLIRCSCCFQIGFHG